MKRKGLILFLGCISMTIISCNRTKTTPEVREAYADGKPKVLLEYTTDQQGEKKLYKETHYFPGEKKYIEGKYDDAANRNGVWTSWYENGQKNSQIKYVNGKEDGDYNTWYPNGKPYITGKYDMGKKIGVWAFHDTLGTVVKEENFGKK
jgi:antitoxin component YwqK of YwqJK toxin-antitoxin module